MFIRATPVEANVPTTIRLSSLPGRLVRRRWLAACIAAGFSVGALSASSAVMAQDSFGPTRVNSPTHPLTATTSPAPVQPVGQPIPRMRTADLLQAQPSQPAASQDSPMRRPGWDLQWRKSPQIASEEAARISNAAFQGPAPQQHETSFQQSVAHAQPMHQAADGHADQAGSAVIVVSGTSRRNQDAATDSIHPAAFLQQPGSGFGLPEFDAAPPADAQPISPPSSGGFGMPSDSGPASGSGTRPNWNANPFRDEAGANPNAVPSNGLNSPVEMVPPGLEELPVPGLDSPDMAPDSFGQPDALGQPDSGSSIRDMLQDESNLPKQSQRSDLETQPSPSDRFESNPFDRRNEEQRNRDELDRMELEAQDGGRLRPQADRDDAAIMGDDDGPSRRASGLSCDDFRSRIAAQTIDQVSLDISPPYRPDVIDEDEYVKLKERFDERQESRTWRSIDGRPMGTGRLVDLAYEKAVIVTEFGAREELPINRLSEADLGFISENWGLPTECLLEQVAFTPRRWKPTTVVWAASNLCHKPLYFEEVNLERYGHTAGPVLQPVLSSAHFFANIAVLPYKMGVHSPHECQYALGYYRPGNCAPWIIPPVPLSLKGAWYQAAAVTGTALLVP
ncbi:hypothetical protein [Rhodopirellula baltica]|uniref:Uncharacterized protein n=1 Tax=Rhodopirellula baltica SWK14 TaxID=993516 RepID=L7C8W5_RHOBT|nr:hypothetical protein [Rhodopirellula baltica]ELP30629.1 hypothetical protein RBSWK_05445 [Rhodopirellula baltica SWK14]